MFMSVLQIYVPTYILEVLWLFVLYFYLCLIIFHSLWYYYIVQTISPWPPSTQQTPLSQAMPLTLFTPMDQVYKLFGYSISYTILYIPMAIL